MSDSSQNPSVEEIAQLVLNELNKKSDYSGSSNITVDKISSKISEMSKAGTKLEVCLTAAKVFGVDPASFLSEIKRVENGW